MAPLAMSSWTRRVAGRKRVHMASQRKVPALRAAATISSPSRAFMAKGFSQRTAFPPAMQVSVFSRWRTWGVAM